MSAAASAPAAVVSNLVIEYRSAAGAVRPVDGLDLVVGDGELVVLLGASGSGKTSVLSALAGIVTPRSGTITVGGLDVGRLDGRQLSAYRRTGIGVVFQAFNLVAGLRAWENVAAPLAVAGVSRREAHLRALEVLDQVGLTDRVDHLPAQLSGGQQQRVAIARALVQEPVLVLADEPTAHLDFLQVDGILRLLRAVARPGRAVLAATHDERLLQRADRVVELASAAHHEIEVPEWVRHLVPGEVLFRPGDPADAAYVVESGGIVLLRATPSGPVVQRRAAAGDHVGELSALLGTTHAELARADQATTVRCLAPSAFRRWARTGGR